MHRLETTITPEERSLLFYALGVATAAVDPPLRDTIVALTAKLNAVLAKAEMERLQGSEAGTPILPQEG